MESTTSLKENCCQKQHPRYSQVAFEIPNQPHSLRLCGCMLQVGFPEKNQSSWSYIIFSVRLNYATTHHDPPPSTTNSPLSKIYPPPPTTSQNMSTTTHHQPKYIHHHPPPAKIYPPLPTISQKMDHHPAKAKIYSYITSFRHCFNSFFFFEMQYSFPWRRFCVIKFWSVRFSNSKFLLHSVHFTIFKIF